MAKYSRGIIRLWGDRSYRFGKGEPAVKVVVKDCDGLVTISRESEQFLAALIRRQLSVYTRF